MCDYVIENDVLLYSHFDSRNLGATMNDMLNVWSILWLTGLSESSRNVWLLNADALRPDRPSFNDVIGSMALHYTNFFKGLLRVSGFEPASTVCIRRLIMQPRPAIRFQRGLQGTSCGRRYSSHMLLLWNSQVAYPYKEKESHSGIVLTIFYNSHHNGTTHRGSGQQSLMNIEHILMEIEVF